MQNTNQCFLLRVSVGGCKQRANDVVFWSFLGLLIVRGCSAAVQDDSTRRLNVPLQQSLSKKLTDEHCILLIISSVGVSLSSCAILKPELQHVVIFPVHCSSGLCKTQGIICQLDELVLGIKLSKCENTTYCASPKARVVPAEHWVATYSTHQHNSLLQLEYNSEVNKNLVLFHRKISTACEILGQYWDFFLLLRSSTLRKKLFPGLWTQPNANNLHNIVVV